MSAVLVLCHGNYMRSPACAAVLRQAGVEGVVSAGFHPRSKKAAKKVRVAMAARGFDLESHRPQLVSAELVKAAKVVLYMDQGNLTRLNELLLVREKDKAMCLGPFAGLKKIQDPAFVPTGHPRFEEIIDEIIKASETFAAQWLKAVTTGNPLWHLRAS